MVSKSLDDELNALMDGDFGGLKPDNDAMDIDDESGDESENDEMKPENYGDQTNDKTRTSAPSVKFVSLVVLCAFSVFPC
jgi:hypothetical protein